MLELKNLTKIYRRSHLGKTTETVGVQDLNLDIRAGEIFGLLGLNGAGKTTTLKLILGLIFPTKGEILLQNQKLPDPSAIQNVGFLPEVPYFPKHFTVQEILQFYGRLSDIPPQQAEKRIEDTLKLVRMWQRRGKRIRECSKGMLQRVSLAQALIHDPKLLILDEPITGLDPLGLTEMRELIVSLNERGKTVLFSSHIISEVEKIAHRVGILVRGKLVQTLESRDWKGETGKLERIFVETVRGSGDWDE